ncbi:MAG: AlpA family transcriptional regulator [Holosporaceae bacterium]|jgi:predicted DNA-binding transcriptional regulator AlpA|nr:AlpA family transcriptional regulator [Holosporaceae bacterium]
MTNKKHGYPNLVDAGKAYGFLRLPQVMQLVPIGKTSIYDKIKKGEFPAQIKLGTKTSVWRREDIDAYIEKMSETTHEVL